MAVKKELIKKFLKHRLGTSKKWSQHALLKIYEYQTREEQEIQRTHDHNGVGFTGVDGEILSSFAEQLKRRGDLSEKQMAIVYKKMPKYWHQVMMISDIPMLENLVLSSN